MSKLGSALARLHSPNRCFSGLNSEEKGWEVKVKIIIVEIIGDGFLEYFLKYSTSNFRVYICLAPLTLG